MKLAPSVRKVDSKKGAEKVISAKFIDAAQGPMVLLLLESGKGMSSFSLAMLDLKSGEVIMRTDVGNGEEAELSVSKRAIIVVGNPLTRTWQQS